MILFIVVWLLCGLIAILLSIMIDLRRKEFNSKYFNSMTCLIFIILFLGGTPSLFIVCVAAIIVKIENNKTSINFRISKLLYNIANIGVNKKRKTNAERLSNLLKGNENSVDSASDEIWNITILNDEFEDYHQLRDWLKEEYKESKCTSK